MNTSAQQSPQKVVFAVHPHCFYIATRLQALHVLRAQVIAAGYQEVPELPELPIDESGIAPRSHTHKAYQQDKQSINDFIQYVKTNDVLKTLNNAAMYAFLDDSPFEDEGLTWQEYQKFYSESYVKNVAAGLLKCLEDVISKVPSDAHWHIQHLVRDYTGCTSEDSHNESMTHYLTPFFSIPLDPTVYYIGAPRWCEHDHDPINAQGYEMWINIAHNTSLPDVVIVNHFDKKVLQACIDSLSEEYPEVKQDVITLHLYHTTPWSSSLYKSVKFFKHDRRIEIIEDDNNSTEIIEDSNNNTEIVEDHNNSTEIIEDSNNSTEIIEDSNNNTEIVEDGCSVWSKIAYRFYLTDDENNLKSAPTVIAVLVTCLILLPLSLTALLVSLVYFSKDYDIFPKSTSNAPQL
jgi:hypothetical protein